MKIKAGRARSSLLGYLLFYPEVEAFSPFGINNSSISSDIFTEDFYPIILSRLLGSLHYLHLLLLLDWGSHTSPHLIWRNIKKEGVSSPES